LPRGESLFGLNGTSLKPTVLVNKLLPNKRLKLLHQLLGTMRMKENRLPKERFTWMSWKVKLVHLDLV
jgi:hypothetical protein